MFLIVTTLIDQHGPVKTSDMLHLSASERNVVFVNNDKLSFYEGIHEIWSNMNLCASIMIQKPVINAHNLAMSTKSLDESKTVQIHSFQGIKVSWVINY